MLSCQKTLEDKREEKNLKSVSKGCLTDGADNNTTVRGLKESHGMSGDGGEVGEGEEEDWPHQAGFHNVNDLTAFPLFGMAFGTNQVLFHFQAFLFFIASVWKLYYETLGPGPREHRRNPQS